MTQRILIIGSGGIANRHAQAIKETGRAVIAGVVDIDRDRAAGFAQRHAGGAPACADAAEALAVIRPDAALISTPRMVREGPIAACLAARVPFLVEKPPCADLATGERLAALIAASGVVHSVGFCFRSNPGVLALLPLLAKHPPLALHSWMTTPLALTIPDAAALPAYWDRSLSGGLVGDQGIHLVDIVRHLASQARSRVVEGRVISGWGSNRFVPREGHRNTVDTAAWTLDLDGIPALHSHTWGATGWNAGVKVITADGEVELDLFACKANGRLGDDTVAVDAGGLMAEWRSQWNGFLDLVTSRNQATARCDFADAVRSFRLALEVEALVQG